VSGERPVRPWRRPRRGTAGLSRWDQLQIVVIVAATAAVLVAAWCLSQAGGAYQDAVREDIKQHAAIQENVRHLYADEAPLGLRVAEAETRAAALRSLAEAGSLAASEYEVARQTAFHLRRAAKPGSLIAGDRYVRDGAGYDLPARLADLEAQRPELRDLDPDATFRDGDRLAARGRAVALAGVAVVLAGALAAGVPRRFRHTEPNPAVEATGEDLDVIPQPGLAAPPTRRAEAYKLGTWVLLLALPLGQLLLAGQEQRAQAAAARRSVQLTADIVVSGQRLAFRATALQEAAVADIGAAGRGYGALRTGARAADAAHESDVAAAELAVAERLSRIAESMGRVPDRDDRVHQATIGALDSRPEDWPRMRIEQGRQVELADRAGNRGLLLSVAAALAAIGSALATAAAKFTAWRRVLLLGAKASIFVSILLSLAVAAR
jgi:hypothetical protein